MIENVELPVNDTSENRRLGGDCVGGLSGKRMHEMGKKLDVMI